MGGWFTIVSTISIMIVVGLKAVTFFAKNGKINSLKRLEFLLYIWLAYVTFVSFTWYVFDQRIKLPIFLDSLFFVITAISTFVLSKSISMNAMTARICLLLLATMALSILVYNSDAQSKFFILRLSLGGESFAVNQLMARSVFMVFILAYYSGRDIQRWASTILALLAIYLLGSRTEFYVLLIFLFLHMFLMMIFGNVKHKLFKVGFLIFGLMALLIYFTLEAFQLTNRMTVVTNLETDASWQHRKVIFENAWQQTLTEPITGIHGRHLFDNNIDLIHNMLSVFQNFGLFAFMTFFLLLFYSLVLSGMNMVSKTHNNRFIFNSVFCVSLGASILVALMFSKSYLWSVIYIYLGLVVGLKKAD